MQYNLTPQQEKKLEEYTSFMEDKELASFDKLKNIEENTQKMVEKTEMMCEKMIAMEMPEMPIIPEPKEVVFPDVQKVEVINQKESVIHVQSPEVNIPAPIVNIPASPAPIVNIDTKDLSDKLEKTNEILSDKPTLDNPLPVVLIFDGKEYKAEGQGNTKIVGGFSGGGAQLIGIEENTQKLLGEYAVVLDDVTTTGMTYVGKAAIGSSTSSAVWQVKRLDETGSPTTLVIKWADGDASFNNVWSDRATLTYS